MRFAVLTNAPMPYRVPVFERLSREEGSVARFFFDGSPELAQKVRALPFDAEHIGSRLVLRRGGYPNDEPIPLRLGFGYLRRLAAFRPDVVISGEFAFVRTETSGTLTRKDSGETRPIATNSAFVLRRESEGAWRIFKFYFRGKDRPAGR